LVLGVDLCFLKGSRLRVVRAGKKKMTDRLSEGILGTHFIGRDRERVRERVTHDVRRLHMKQAIQYNTYARARGLRGR
jgi:hypothetical protein